MADTKVKAARRGQQGKPVEEVVEYAISHRTRVRVLSLLNEGAYSPAEISKVLGIPIPTLSHHIRELLAGGSIEVAKVDKTGNLDKHYYRAIKMPFYSDEEVWAMPPLQRQVSAGLIIQNVMAEVMAAFWAGKIRDDPNCWLAWRWFNVDAQGRRDIAGEQMRFWERMQEIEAESIGRRIESGEEATSVIVSELAFERERTSPNPPIS